MKSLTVVKKSLSVEEKISEYGSIDDHTKALLHKDEPSRGNLYIFGNILSGVVSLGIIHAIFYIGSLMAYGAQL